MRSSLALSALLALSTVACDVEIAPANATGTDPTWPLEHPTAIGLEAPGDSVTLLATLTDLSGVPVHGGLVCLRRHCLQIEGAVAHLELPAATEVELVMYRPEGEVRAQFVSEDSDAIGQILVPSQADIEDLAAAFDVQIEPGLATLIQFVVDEHGDVPTLSAPADGPFRFELDGAPAAAGPGPAYVVFFNVEPGLHELDHGLCDEGPTFWGPLNDGRIDVQLAADTTLVLQPVVCL